MECSSTLTDLLPALIKARQSMGSVLKSQDNKFLSDKNKKKISYADITDYLDACIEPLLANGLILTQTHSFSEGKGFLETTLFHVSGQYMKSKMVLPLEGGPQVVGSLITYYRRYMLGPLLALSAEDDDGNKAQQTQEKHDKEKAATMAAKPAAQSTLTPGQINELTVLCKAMSADRQTKFWNYCKGQLQAFDWHEIPPDQYDYLKSLMSAAEK